LEATKKAVNRSFSHTGWEKLMRNRKYEGTAVLRYPPPKSSKGGI
jgi:hypothetical protein